MTAARTRRDGTPTPRRKGPRGEASGKIETPTRDSKRPSKRPPAKKGRGATIWRWTRRALIALAVLAVLAVSGVIGAFWHFGRDLPDVQALRDHQEPQVTRVIDRDGEILGESWQERRTVIDIERVPRSLVLSVLAANLEKSASRYAPLLRIVEQQGSLARLAA